ncbi:AAA family ATPase [Gulosibacter faecalis]|uniref:AAA family ATPase n=1 Tax=Gulosibacter faecalis TaxID=272240 RepID=A0ABW5UTY4_9MICO|nr:AAA family ATPase [Gulosibacter faecalis]
MIDNERTVLGALMLDSRYLGEAMKAVAAEDFQDERLGRIFRGMVDMQGLGEPVDVITVSGKLKTWGVIGIEPADLHTWVGEVFTAANVSYYAELVARAALERGVVKVATQLRDSAGDPVSAVREGMSALEGLQKRAAGADFQLRTVRDLLDFDTSHDWLISGLLERKDRLMLTGFEGLGKSTFLRQLVFAAAAGVHPFRDWQSITPRRCLVIDAENTERQWARAARGLVSQVSNLQADGNLSENLAVANIRRIDITRPDELMQIHQLVDRVNPDIVMIGPLYRLTKGAINDDDEAAPVLAALDTLRDRGLALLIEAHAGKSMSKTGERQLAPRGSSALLGWPEFGMGLRVTPKGKPGEVDLVRWRGDREERMWPKRLIKSSNGLPFQEVQS